MKIRRVTALVIGLVLLVNLSIITGTTLVAGSEPVIEPNYTSRGVIRINSDLDFNVLNGVVSGDGSEATPYIISGWDINGTDEQNCIYIGNTTSYFVIEDCNLSWASRSGFGGGGGLDDKGEIPFKEGEGTPLPDGEALYVFNSKNAILRNNTISHSKVGIETIESDTILVFDNNLTYVWNYPLYIVNSNNITIDNNNIYNCFDYGISIEEEFNPSNYNKITNNTITNCFVGIYNDEDCHYTNISHNTITNSSEGGIYTDNGNQHLSIYDNTINIVETKGFYLYGLQNSTLVGNSVSNATEYGFWLHECDNNLLYGNNIFDNTVNALDDFGNNQWYYDYVIGGNYWGDYSGVDEYSGMNQDIAGSDGIGDTPYENIEFNLTFDKYPIISFYGIEEAGDGTGEEVEDPTATDQVISFLISLLPLWILLLILKIIIDEVKKSMDGIAGGK